MSSNTNNQGENNSLILENAYVFSYGIKLDESKNMYTLYVRPQNYCIKEGENSYTFKTLPNFLSNPPNQMDYLYGFKGDSLYFYAAKDTLIKSFPEFKYSWLFVGGELPKWK